MAFFNVEIETVKKQSTNNEQSIFEFIKWITLCQELNET